MSRAKMLAAVTAAVFAASVAVAAPASAEITVPSGQDQQQSDPPPTAPPAGGATSEGGTNYGSAGNCSVVSSPSYLGLACGDGSITHKSIKEILGDQPVPDCWNEKLTDAELTAMNLENRDGNVWYWERCLKGIDKKTKKIVGPVHFTVGVVSIGPGEHIETLTHQQQVLVNMYGRDGTIPYPVAGVSPKAQPLVNQDVSFFDGTDGEVVVPAGGVTLAARVVKIDVEPLGKGRGDKVSCAGRGYVAKKGDTKASHPEGCWYRYAHSSAAQSDNTYPAYITAHWAVTVTYQGVTTPFNTFTKSQVTDVPVAEIQAIVVR